MSKNNEIHLSGRVIKKRINGRIVEVLTNPKKPTITWEELVELFKNPKKN